MLLRDSLAYSDLDGGLSELLEAYKESHLVKPEGLIRTTSAGKRSRMKGRSLSKASRLPLSPKTFSKEESARSSEKDFWNET